MTWQRKILAAFIGLAFTFAFVETILTGIGTAQNLMRRNASADAGANGDSGAPFTILCLGNSYTLGTGAPPGHAFSDHLQRMLDSKKHSTRFNVVNRGRGNVNSTFILETLPEHIEKLHPQVIVLMTGEPNFWNRQHYNRHLARIGSGSAASWSDSLYDWMYGLRTFRLVTLLLKKNVTDSTYVSGRYSDAFPGDEVDNYPVIGMKWVGAIEGGNSYNVYHLTDEQSSEAIASLEKMIELGRGNRNVYNTLARIYAISRKNFAQAAPYYAKAIEAEPEKFDFYAYSELAEALQGYLHLNEEQDSLRKKLLESASRTFPGQEKYERLKKWFNIHTFPSELAAPEADAQRIAFLELARQVLPTFIRTHQRLADMYVDKGELTLAAHVIMDGLRANPFSAESDLYNPLREIETKTKNASLQADIQAFIAELGRDYPSETYRAEKMDDHKLADWIRADIEEIIRISKENGIHVVLQSYAPLRRGGKRVADRVVREIAIGGNYPFADNMTVFTDAFRNGVDPESLYSNEFGPTDSHLNSDGYRFMAEILLKTLKERHLLPE